ncbi:MAG: SHOCT domain-containing protein [Gemmatimonadetes bacterium]|nr:SHOCT domain-containing protein [Gemmatimonadota bacterium]
MHWFDPGMGWGWTVFGGAMMVLFWGAVIWLIAGLVRGRAPERSYHPAERPDDVAARRFAAGEIDEQQYERILHRLYRSPGEHHGWPSAPDRPDAASRKVE